MCNEMITQTDNPRSGHQPAASSSPSTTGKATAAAPADLQQQPPVTKNSRHKLWNLPEHLLCPIIGTCFAVAELRRLARKLSNISTLTVDASDYEIHVGFVSNAGSKNALSLAAHKALDKKHAAHVRRFSKARTRQQLDALWQDALACGEVPGGFWALLTHPRCDRRLQDRAREEVHMLSHQIGAGQRADLKCLAETRSELANLKHDFDAWHRRTRKQLEVREKRILDLETRLRACEARCRHLATAKQGLEQQLDELQAEEARQIIERMMQRLADQGTQLRDTQRQRDHWRHSCETAERKLATLDAEVEQRRAESAALERLMEQSAVECRDCDEAGCAACPDLGGRLILCVGGRNQLISQYRDMVSQCNGRFDHHDGGIEDNRQRLEVMLTSADAVFCPTDCVSHDAYHRLKRICKRYRKPCVLLRSSGLSSFARALESLTESSTAGNCLA
jgi:hypothetical protein